MYIYIYTYIVSLWMCACALDIPHKPGRVCKSPGEDIDDLALRSFSVPTLTAARGGGDAAGTVVGCIETSSGVSRCLLPPLGSLGAFASLQGPCSERGAQGDFLATLHT